jgi:hypothetical protein
MILKILGTALIALGLSGVAHAEAATDVNERPLPLGNGRPALVFYVNKGTREALGTTAFPFAYELRADRPIVVVHVDLSDVPGLLKSMAKGEIRKAQRESLAEMASIFREHGQEPPAWLGDSLYMVADGDGAPHRAVGLQKKFSVPFAQALGPNGDELARGPFPASAPVIGKAIAKSALAQQAAR